MCDSCSPSSSLEDLYDHAQAIAYANVELVNSARKFYDKLDPRIQDIIDRFLAYPALTERQAQWIEREAGKFEEAAPLYGDFKAIWVMFRLSGLKKPKIRLLSPEGKFIQLTFISEEGLTEFQKAQGQKPRILLHQGGWAGHGQRFAIGEINEDLIVLPKRKGSIDEDILSLLQAFSLDPRAVAQASASKLGACSFCGSRLTDPESKKQGYGPICAGNYNLPWGDVTERDIENQKRFNDIPAENLL